MGEYSIYMLLEYSCDSGFETTQSKVAKTIIIFYFYPKNVCIAKNR